MGNFVKGFFVGSLITTNIALLGVIGLMSYMIYKNDHPEEFGNKRLDYRKPVPYKFRTLDAKSYK